MSYKSSLQPRQGGFPHRNADEPLIAMRDIVKTFHTTAGEFTALKGINADFYPGEFVSVVGKSGSGKSTLVNMITGIDHPTSGSVCVGETCIHNLSEGKMSIWRGRNLGIVFQFFQLLPTLSLLENVMLPMDFCNVYDPGEREKRAMNLLGMVGLEDYAHELPAAVSGGQQQSAAIARALANDPPIIIADEPTGNLDSRTAESVFAIFNDLAQQGKTILMVTHDSSLAQRTDRTLLLSDGELIDPWIAAAFPGFSHKRLLWLTHRMDKLSFQPWRPIPLPYSQQANLYLITSGQVALSGNFAGLPDPEQKILMAGEQISVLDLETDRGVEITLQAVGDEPVEILSLDSGSFSEWMNASPLDRDRLKQAAQQRLASRFSRSLIREKTL